MAHAVLKEISSIRSFFESRGGSASDASALQKSFADSILNKLKLMKEFGPAEGAQINGALSDSPLGEVHTDRIVKAIDDLLAKRSSADAVASSKHAVGGGGSSQFLKHWWH